MSSSFYNLSCWIKASVRKMLSSVVNYIAHNEALLTVWWKYFYFAHNFLIELPKSVVAYIWLIHWLINFNSMLTHLGLFYTKSFGNCMYIYLQFLCSFLQVFTLTCRISGIPIEIIYKQIYLTHSWNPNRYYHAGVGDWR